MNERYLIFSTASTLRLSSREVKSVLGFAHVSGLESQQAIRWHVSGREAEAGPMRSGKSVVGSCRYGIDEVLFLVFVGYGIGAKVN